MKNNLFKSEKKSLWLVVLIVVILICFGIYLVTKNSKVKNLINQPKESLDKTSESDKNSTPDSSQGAHTLSNSQENSNGNLDSSQAEQMQDEKSSNETADEPLRQKIIAYVNQNLNKLIPPPKTDTWDVPSFYFVGNSKLYVELYGSETDLVGIEVLYDVQKEGNGFKLTELARYKEGEEDWTLVSGKDDYSDYSQDDYEYNEETKLWEKIDDLGAEGEDIIDASSEDSNNNSILP